MSDEGLGDIAPPKEYADGDRDRELASRFVKYVQDLEPGRKMAVAFFDLARSTPMKAAKGDNLANFVVQEHNLCVVAAIEATRCTSPVVVWKFLGDGVLVGFDDIGDAVAVAIRFAREFRRLADAINRDVFQRVGGESIRVAFRIGIHHGPLRFIRYEVPVKLSPRAPAAEHRPYIFPDDPLGLTVDTAQRVCAAARSDCIAISAAAIDAWSGAAGQAGPWPFDFGLRAAPERYDVGEPRISVAREARVKGRRDPMQLHEVFWADGGNDPSFEPMEFQSFWVDLGNANDAGSPEGQRCIEFVESALALQRSESGLHRIMEAALVTTMWHLWVKRLAPVYDSLWEGRVGLDEAAGLTAGVLRGVGPLLDDRRVPLEDRSRIKSLLLVLLASGRDVGRTAESLRWLSGRSDYPWAVEPHECVVEWHYVSKWFACREYLARGDGGRLEGAVATLIEDAAAGPWRLRAEALLFVHKWRSAAGIARTDALFLAEHALRSPAVDNTAIHAAALCHAGQTVGGLPTNRYVPQVIRRQLEVLGFPAEFVERTLDWLPP